MSTIGAFIKEKLLNMAIWLETEVGKENMNVDLQTWVTARSVLECTMFAEVLHEHADTIAKRDWATLLDAVQTKELPATSELIKHLLVVVKGRIALHDKFWRYLDLFCDVVSSNHS